MVKLVTPDKVDAALTAAVNAGDDTSVPDTPNNAFKAAMQAKGFFEDDGTVSNIPTPLVAGNFLKVRSDLELEWATIDTLPTTSGGEDDMVLVIRGGQLVWEHLIPKPYIADWALSNNGTSLIWKALPETKLPPVSECTSENGCILTVVNDKVVWEPYTPAADSLLPETNGKGGKVLSTDGTALASGGGLSWAWPAGAPGSGTPGSIIGYAHAYSITNGDRADVFTFEATSYTDRAAGADTPDPGAAPYHTLKWGSTLVTTVDTEGGELGHWTADGEFVFERDAYVMVNAGQQVVANFNSATGKPLAAEIHIVHSRLVGELDGIPTYDSDILDIEVGRDFVWPYHSTPIISGTMSCATTVSAGDKILVTALVTMFDGNPGTLSYGSLHHSLRANFGILATVGFPKPIAICPILAEARVQADGARLYAAEFETDELAIEALADYDSDAYRTFGTRSFDMDETRPWLIEDSDTLQEIDFVVTDDIDLQLTAYVSVEFYDYDSDWTVPPEALLLHYQYNEAEDVYKAPVVLARITTKYVYVNPEDMGYYLGGKFKYAGMFGRRDRIRMAYSFVSTGPARSRYGHHALEVRSCYKERNV